MGKNKRKKHNKKKVLSRTKFISKVCEQCLVCGDDTDAEFCYDVMYLKRPNTFRNFCEILLTATEEWVIDEEGTVSQENIELFESIFCEANMCDTKNDGSCHNLGYCMDAFNSQITHSYNIDGEDEDTWEAERMGADSTGMEWSTPKYQRYSDRKGNKKKKNKKKQKTVPIATFFCNDPEKWRERIQRLLYGNNDSKQDKIKSAARKAT